MTEPMKFPKGEPFQYLSYNSAGELVWLDLPPPEEYVTKTEIKEMLEEHRVRMEALIDEKLKTHE